MQNIGVFQEKAGKIRREIFEKLVLLQQGHPGSVFSIVDLMTALYYGDFVRRSPDDPTRLHDKVIISKGHAAVCLYPILADLGVLPAHEWERWGHAPSLLRVFGNIAIPGIDATSGSLGHGLGIAAGYALSFKRRNSDQRVFCIMSEGELYEGSIWESLLFINHHKLDNLYVILDRNNLIILGDTEACLRLEPIKQKLEGFGFRTEECDGHDFTAILGSLERMIGAKSLGLLIANTVKGQGVRLMEGKAQWHYWNPLSPVELAACREDLR